MSDIPPLWRQASLRDVCQPVRSKTVNPLQYPNELFEYYSIPAFQEGGRPLHEEGRRIRSNKIVVDNHTVLFGKLNPRVLKVWLVESASPLRKIATTEFLPVLANDAALPHYLYYLCQSAVVVDEAARSVSGSTPSRERVDPNAFYNIAIPLPPLSEQRAIVRALRAAQDARDARRRELEVERERKSALMDDLLAFGVRGEPCQQTDLGALPESWSVTRFDAVAAIARGQVDPKQDPYKSLPHVGPENIEAGTGRLSTLRSNGELRVISGNYRFTAENVLYSKIRPYLSKVALPSFEGTCSADMYPIVPIQGEVTREYLFYYLLSERFLRQVTASQDRTGIPKVNRDQLNAVLVAKPPLDEQQKIAEVLAACDRRIAALETEAALHDELFRAMLDNLMTGRLSALPLVDHRERDHEPTA